ncbi:MAG: zinc ribbon domain-containing protein [Nitrososphaera sp.]|jgi:hypothetical protein
MAKLFNGRSATEDYMSTHSLTFSTPEMTLRKFALWLGELVNSPSGQVPRLMTYIEEKGGKSDEAALAPDIDESFKPTGAVTDMYGSGVQSLPSDQQSPPKLTPLNRKTLEPEEKFCINCGQKLKANAKFCTKCGATQ